MQESETSAVAQNSTRRFKVSTSEGQDARTGSREMLGRRREGCESSGGDWFACSKYWIQTASGQSFYSAAQAADLLKWPNSDASWERASRKLSHARESRQGVARRWRGLSEV